MCSTFDSFCITCFLLFVLVVSFSQKSNRLVWICLSTFFVLYSFVVRHESSLQKNNLSSFKLVLIWFGYRGFSFLSHAISLRFVVCDVSKPLWLF